MVNYTHSTDIQPFAIAFGVSGSSKFAEKFELNFHSVVAEYETTGRTDSAFVHFRIQCMRFIAWIETMRAAWAAACTSGALQGILSTNAQPQVQLFDLSTPILRLIKQAVKSLEEVRNLKDRYGSFETEEHSDGR